MLFKKKGTIRWFQMIHEIRTRISHFSASVVIRSNRRHTQKNFLSACSNWMSYSGVVQL